MFSWWFYFFYPWRLLFAIYIDISILFVLHTVYHFNRSGNASEKRFLDHHETLRPYSERLWHSMTKRCSFFEASQRSEAAEHTDGSGRKVDPGFFNPSSGSKSSVTFSQSEATFLPKIKDKIDMR